MLQKDTVVRRQSKARGKEKERGREEVFFLFPKGRLCHLPWTGNDCKLLAGTSNKALHTRVDSFISALSVPDSTDKTAGRLEPSFCWIALPFSLALATKPLIFSKKAKKSQFFIDHQLQHPPPAPSFLSAPSPSSGSALTFTISDLPAGFFPACSICSWKLLCKSGPESDGRHRPHWCHRALRLR